MANEQETPVVPMGATPNQAVVNPQPPTYEQLQAKVVELAQRCQQMQFQLEQANYIISNKQLDYMFKVLDNHTLFNPNFIDYCVSEVTRVLQGPEEDKKE